MRKMMNNGEWVILTEEEIKYYRAIKRLEKMNSGNLRLFANGDLLIRYGGISGYRTIEATNISCEGGDGGDDMD